MQKREFLLEDLKKIVEFYWRVLGSDLDVFIAINSFF